MLFILACIFGLTGPKRFRASMFIDDMMDVRQLRFKPTGVSVLQDFHYCSDTWS